MEFLVRKAVIAVLLTLCCGCSMMPRALHPSQLWKWNYQDARDEGTWSISDPVDPRLTDAARGGPGGDAATGADRP